MPKRSERVYWREQGGERRAYGDFRDFRDVGGGREALKVKGAKRATTDPDVAADIAAARVKDLERRRRSRQLLGVEKEATLKAFAAHHLQRKAKSGRTSLRWMEQTEQKLRTAVAHFGADRDLMAIRVEDVQMWADALAQEKEGRGGRPRSPGTVRHYLNVLSNLYTRAASEGCVPPGFNPVAAMMDKPIAERREASWLEPHDAALLLESARTYRPAIEPVKHHHGGTTSAKPNPHLFPIIATFLLTGGRKSEVLGLEVDDVSFQRKTITFRPNSWRTLKTGTSHRPIPLWPQLEEILREYLVKREQAGGVGTLLFPSIRPPKPRPGEPTPEEAMIKDLRKGLDAVAERAGWKAGDVRTKMFRHTYCAARLQSLDRGAPVSPYTVARELGHGGRGMVDRVYGHLGEVRHRSEGVSFLVQDHRELLGDRLRGLEAEGV